MINPYSESMHFIPFLKKNMSIMIHTLLVLPSGPSFVVLPVVGAFNIGTSSLSLLAAVDGGIAANEGIPSVPTATVKVVDVIIVIVSMATI